MLPLLSLSFSYKLQQDWSSEHSPITASLAPCGSLSRAQTCSKALLLVCLCLPKTSRPPTAPPRLSNALNLKTQALQGSLQMLAPLRSLPETVKLIQTSTHLGGPEALTTCANCSPITLAQLDSASLENRSHATHFLAPCHRLYKKQL